MDDPVARAESAFDLGRNLTHAWSALKRCFPVLFVGGCLKSCTEGGGGSGNLGDLADLVPDHDDKSSMLQHLGSPFAGLDPARVQSSLPFDLDAWTAGLGVAALVGIGVVVLLVVIALFVFRAWLLPGWIRTQAEVLRTGNTDFATLFSGADRLVPMLGWVFLQGILLAGSVLVAAAPGVALVALGMSTHEDLTAILGGVVAAVFALPVGIYVGLGLAFGGELITLDDRGVMDALSESWELASGSRLRMVLFGIGLALVRLGATVVGMLMCCVGVLVTAPSAIALSDTSWTEAYLRLTRSRDELAGWAMESGQLDA